MTRWRQRTLGEQIYLTLGLMLVAVLIAVVCASFPSSTWDFRNNLWGPTHLLLDGRSPYRIDQLFDGSNSVWMPTAIGSLLPLGALTLSQASLLWSIAMLATLVALVFASSRMRRPYPLWLGVGLMAVFLFPPTVTHFQWGQFAVFAVLGAMLAAELMERGGRTWLIALVLVLSAAKPQLLLLAGVGVVVGLWRLRGVGSVLRLALFGLAWAALFIAPLFLLFPGWWDGLLWAFERNPSWLHPSSFVMLRETLGAAGLAVWAVMLAAAVGLTALLWWRLPPTLAVLWTLALTLLVTPYVWSYDFVLLLPLLVYTLFRVRHWLARLVWIGGFVAMWLVFVQLRLTTSNSDDIFWWVPWAGMGLVLLCWGISMAMGRRSSRTTPPPLGAQITKSPLR